MVLELLEHAMRRRVWARNFRLWHHPAYRLPMVGLESHQGIEPRRADFVRWYLLDDGVISAQHLRTPEAIGYPEMARVHTPEFLESLSNPQTLGRIFATHTDDLPVDEVMRSVRLACGGTLEAARWVIRERAHAMNLLGGFHHAAPDRGGGLCPINDIAVAVAALRDEGFKGQVAIIDLDAHPPDGLSACFQTDARVWIGSLSASDWGRLPNVRETLLPPGTGDREYLRALKAMLRNMPRAPLCFVIAGGDVLADDRLGRLGLTVKGAQRRDWMVFKALRNSPTVWLPGGGYHKAAWRVLANTVRVLVLHSSRGVRADFDPLLSRFAFISTQLSEDKLHGDPATSASDVDELFGARPTRKKRLLGYYTEEGIEYGLFRYGIMGHLERLGYRKLRIVLEDSGSGDRVRVYGSHAGREYVVIEAVYEQRTVDGQPVLFVNWMELMHPLASFSAARPRLPGQKHPGLGLAKEATVMLGQMARRIGAKGVVFRPAYFHVAHGARRIFSFADPVRQGRFEAMIRDLADVPTEQITQACVEGRMMLNGEPYTWEPTDMVSWLDGPPEPDDEGNAERERCRFSVSPTRPAA